VRLVKQQAIDAFNTTLKKGLQQEFDKLNRR
jgi:hypothetical protein